MMPDGYLVKENWRTKTFTLSGFIAAHGVAIQEWLPAVQPDPHCYPWRDIPTPGENAGVVSVSVPGVCLSLGFEWEWSNVTWEEVDNAAALWEDMTYKYPGEEGYIPFDATGKLIVNWSAYSSNGPPTLSYGSGQIEYEVHYDAIACGPNCLLYTSPAGIHFLSGTLSKEVSFSLQVIVPMDRYTDLFADESASGENMYSGYPIDRGGSWLMDQTRKEYEAETLSDGKGLARMKLYIGGEAKHTDPDGDLLSDTAGWDPDVHRILSENNLYALLYGEGLDPDNAERGYRSDSDPLAQVTFDRSVSGCDYGSHVYESSAPHNPSLLNGYEVIVEVDTDTVSLTGWWDKWYGTAGPLSQITFDDYCGSYSCDYASGNLKRIDGSAITGTPSFTTDTEGHPSWEVGESGWGDWEWPEENPSFNENEAEFTYNGWWRLYTGSSAGWFENTDDYALDSHNVEFIDLPQDPRTSPPATHVRHGGLWIENIGDLGEPNYPGGSPAYSDRRIPLLGDGDLSYEAVEVSLAGTGEVATPLEFDEASGWSHPNCSLEVSGSRFHAYDVGTSAYLEKDLTAAAIRLTGTRYARLYWQADTNGAEMRVTISGQTWQFYAQGTGPQIALFDLCRPSCTRTPAEETDSLKYDSADGKLLYEDDSGKLARDCCCYTCEADQQQDSIIGIELPYAGAGNHGWLFNRGWGVGRVTTVTFELKTAGAQYWIEKIALYRKTPGEGGFAAIYVNPQNSFNNTRTLDDPGLIAAGAGRYVGRSGLIIIDGAVVAEIPAYRWTYDAGVYTLQDYWCDLEGSPPIVAYPLNDYESPTGIATNGVFDLSVLDKPSEFWETFSSMCLFDRVAGTLTDGQKLTQTSRSEHIEIPLGFGNVPHGGRDKWFRGQIQALVFKGHQASQEEIEIVPGGGEQPVNAEPNALGWCMSPALKTLQQATIDGYLNISTRSRLQCRAIVSKS